VRLIGISQRKSESVTFRQPSRFLMIPVRKALALRQNTLEIKKGFELPKQRCNVSVEGESPSKQIIMAATSATNQKQ
jgi:hypothetical protein